MLSASERHEISCIARGIRISLVLMRRGVRFHTHACRKRFVYHALQMPPF